MAVPVVRAGDPVAGLALFNNVPDAVVSCSNASCHGPNPNDNIHGLQKAGNNGGVILSAIRNGVPQMMFLNGLLNPFQIDDIAAYLAPQPFLSTEAMDFAVTPVGNGSDSQTATLENPGGVDLVVTAMTLAGVNPGDFELGGSCKTGIVLQSSIIDRAGGQCTITVRFLPQAMGARAAILTLTYGGTTTYPSTQSISLTGAASAPLPPQAAFSTTALGFGEVRVGDASEPAVVTLSSVGAGPLVLGNVGLLGPESADFDVTGSCVSGATVPAGSSCNLVVRFRPSDLDLRTASVLISHNASGTPATIALSGTGITFACATPAPPAESREIACSAGQVGSLVQTRVYSCFDRAWVPDEWFTISNHCQVGAPPASIALTEFFNVDLVHYFMTAEPAEAQGIDAGAAGPGWQRTHERLGLVWGNAAVDGALVPVCRFYGNPALGPDGRRLGPNSHFYTAEAAECAAVKEDPGWIYEGIVFQVVPAVGGSCPQGLLPVRRVYNGRFAEGDSNHRYATDSQVVGAMVDEGWIPEGIVFCVASP